MTTSKLHTFFIPNKKELNEILRLFREQNVRYYPVRRRAIGWRITLDEDSPFISYLMLKYTSEIVDSFG